MARPRRHGLNQSVHTRKQAHTRVVRPPASRDPAAVTLARHLSAASGKRPTVPDSSQPLHRRIGAALTGSGGHTLADTLRECTGRIPVPTAEDRTAWDAVDAGTRAALLAEADAARQRPAPVLRASDWARTFRDGVRTAFEESAGELRARAALMVTAAVLADEAAPASAPPGAAPCLDEAADCLVSLIEASTWCWAPHDRFAATRGELLPDPDHPFLDLGAAEVALLLAWTDHVLGTRLETRLPGLRRRIAREVRLRVLDPFRQVGDWHWIGSDGSAHNWNAWIHHAVLTCALLLTDGEERAELVRLVVRGLDHYVAVLPDDGGIDEGVSYWWLGAGQLLESLDLLAAAGGPALDARDLPLLAEICRYPQRVHLGGPWHVNVGDAPARLTGHQPWHLLHRWGRLLGDPGMCAYSVAGARVTGLLAHPRQGLGRALEGLTDERWRQACAAAEPDEAAPPTGRRGEEQARSQPWLAREVWLPDIQLLVAREESGSSAGLALSVKGGHNDERHNHLDVGSFSVALDGQPMVVDVGKPTYTAASFGPGRYDAWPLRSQWHNVPEIADTGQLPGVAHRAREVAADLSDAAVSFSADLAAAYPEGAAGRWRRTVRLERAAADRPAHVLVLDHARVPPGGVLLRYVLAGAVDEDETGRGSLCVRAGGGRALRLLWDPASFTASVEHRPLDDDALRACWGPALARLTLRPLRAAAGTDLRAWLRAERAG